MSQLLQLVWTFLKTGAFTFGGGYAMIPILYREVVEVQRWVTAREFLDAVAISQATPGPVAIVATIIGYRVAGAAGATAATVAVFAPSVAAAIAASRAYREIRRSPLVAAAIAGLKPALVGLLLAAAAGLGRDALTDPGTIAVAAAVFAGAVRGVDPVILIVGAGLAGLLIR